MPTSSSYSFFFNDTATTEIYTLSLHDALPILILCRCRADEVPSVVIDVMMLLRRSERIRPIRADRSEEHTSELQSLRHLVCRLLLEKKKKKTKKKNCK